LGRDFAATARLLYSYSDVVSIKKCWAVLSLQTSGNGRIFPNHFRKQQGQFPDILKWFKGKIFFKDSFEKRTVSNAFCN
jgi:hypothetical protein